FDQKGLHIFLKLYNKSILYLSRWITYQKLEFQYTKEEVIQAFVTTPHLWNLYILLIVTLHKREVPTGHYLRKLVYFHLKPSIYFEAGPNFVETGLSLTLAIFFFPFDLYTFI
ncbi:hypothetical protein ACJX0J_011912, partial [Zea mays]